MKETIRELITEIEEEYDIVVLFAVESGSRAWGMSSEDSDYDIRFVFKRPLDAYISLKKNKDVIIASYDKDSLKVPAKGCVFDFQGFDIHKYLGMMLKSNPSCIEWLKSDIVYTHLGMREKLLEWMLKNVQSKKLFYHYKSMCGQNYIKYLKSEKLVTYKKYLYAMRGLVNALWVKKYNTIPPIDFNDTLNASHDLLPINIILKVKEIIRLKQEGKEKDIIENIVAIDNFIESFLKEEEDKIFKGEGDVFFYSECIEIEAEEWKKLDIYLRGEIIHHEGE